MAINAETSGSKVWKEFIAEWSPQDVLQHSTEQPQYDRIQENEWAVWKISHQEV